MLEPIQRLYWSQAQVILNDNASKIILIGLLNNPVVVGDGPKGMLITLVAAAVLVPFIVLAPVNGWLADRFSKRDVLRVSLWAQAFIIVGFCVSFLFESLPLAFFFLALLAVQSAAFSPAKLGIVKELVPGHRVPKAISWVEMLGVGSILIGTLFGAMLFDTVQRGFGVGPWGGGVFATLVLLLFALWAVFLFRKVPSHPGYTEVPFTMSLFVNHFRQLGYLWDHKPLFLAGMGNSFFFGVGGILYLTFVEYGDIVHSGQAGASTLTAILLTVLGIPLGIGSYLVGVIHQSRIKLSMIGLGIAGMALGLGLTTIGFFSVTPMIYIGLVVTGVGAGFFNVTVNAYLVDRAPADHRGRVIAAANLLTNVTGLAGIGFYWFMRDILLFKPDVQMVVLTVITAGCTVFCWLLLRGPMKSLVLRMIGRPVQVG